MFHERCGARVILSNHNRTATRCTTEFNFGLVISSQPLQDDELFEVRIDKKVDCWIGSLDIGVTTCDPERISFPPCATDLRQGTWLLSVKSILKDGRALLETYPMNLDKITEGERVGMMRTSNNELEFFLNGEPRGIAATDIPQRVFAIIDVYGKVSQVSITSPVDNLNASEHNQINVRGPLPDPSDDGDFNTDNACEAEFISAVPHERMRFHDRAGSLVKLSCSGRSAERIRPLDEFNNAVVMTDKQLIPDVLFEIRIDRLVEKWSGSIEVGVTTHDPNELEFPATMTNMRSGTVMMSGCGILTNGKGTKREYGDYNLDELRVGDRIGMMRKKNGDLHYFINGLDQGVAASNVAENVWGVVDLYGMTVKVTIVDRDEREEQNLITRRNTVLRESVIQAGQGDIEDDVEEELLFHPNCGSHAAVINNGRTAHRPNAFDDFNNAVVLTNRPLKLNEVFEVRIDSMVTKWAGSIEIGVTTHAPQELDYPSTMTNVRSGTWIMTGSGVMHNGTTVIDDYGLNLDRLQAGDRVGVVIREGGALHFLVNGDDQGEAGVCLPSRLFAVIDLYGQASQATIVSHCPSCSAISLPLVSPSHWDIHFHSVHGRNVRVTNGGKTASRPRSTVEFKDAIVVTNRPLRQGEMFSIAIERIIGRWAGSIAAGVTAIPLEELELPCTMADLDHDTWMLSGFTLMKDGVTLQHGYSLNLDQIAAGSVIGMRRHDDGTLHFYLDGADQGEACSGLPELVYPIIDLYGQCAQVSIISTPEQPVDMDELSFHQLPSHSPSDTTVLPNHQQLLHRLHIICGKNITLDELGTSAIRSNAVDCGGLVFSSSPLVAGELFDVSVDTFAKEWAGCLSIGVTTFVPSEQTPVPLRIHLIKEPVWYMAGSEIMQGTEVIKYHYAPSLEWLRPGNRVGVKRSSEGHLHIFIDGVDQGIAAFNIPKRVHAVVDIFGSTTGIKVASRTGAGSQGEAPLAVLDLESPCDKNIEATVQEGKKEDEMEKSIEDGELISEVHDFEGVGEIMTFHDCHGRNIHLSENKMTAKRVASYNQGLVLASGPLHRTQLFQLRIESISTSWTSSLSIGVTSSSALTSSLPVTALGLKKDTWIIAGDAVYLNGCKVKSRYGPNLDRLGVGTVVGILIDMENNLHLYIDGVDHGIAATNMPLVCFPVVDLYGMCDQLSISHPLSELNAGDLSVNEEQISSVKGEVMAASITSQELDEEANEDEEKCDIERQEKIIIGDVARSKSDKMNENIQCCSVNSPTGSASNYKLITSSENLILQQQTAEKRANEEKSTISKSPPMSPRLSGTTPISPVSPVSVSAQCDYLTSVLRLKASLGLPSGFFKKDMGATCYCAVCHSMSRKQELGVNGWARLPLRVRNSRGDAPTDQWHVAFIGTSLGAVRRILDVGELLTPGELGLGKDLGRRCEDKKLESSDASQVVLCPTLLEASKPSSAPKHIFVDPKTKESFIAVAALQVLVRPGSYKVASDSEWVTKERNATILAALLLKLEPV